MNKNRSKTNEPQSRRVEIWKLSRIKPNPRQGKDISPLPEPELRALEDDIKRNGVIQPLEVTENGTLLDGHNRYHVLKRMGKDKVKVLVRYDLPTAEMQHRRFLEANLTRRQLDSLGKVKLIAAMVEADLGKPLTELPPRKLDKVKTDIAMRLDMSGRSVSRYLLAAKAPQEVQEAFGRNEVSLINTGKVALLHADDQADVVDRINQGESAKSVIAEYLAPPRRQRSPLGLFLDAIENAKAAFESAEHHESWAGQQEVIREFHEWFATVLQELQRDTMS
jgi:ParB/RepB/Spo0J family partition protein